MATDSTAQQWRADVARARAVVKVSDGQLRRVVVRAVREQGATQTDVARVLGVSQPTVHRWLQEAGRRPQEGPQALGADPYEIAQRYAAGDITREQMHDALVAWPYERDSTLDGDYWDKTDPGAAQAGTFSATVGQALTDGLLSDEEYDAILDGLPAA
jgi:transposase-like protein